MVPFHLRIRTTNMLNKGRQETARNHRMSVPAGVTVIDHPLVQHKLSLMRARDTDTATFRALCREVGMLMAYEAFRDLELATATIATPLVEMAAPTIAGKKLVLAPILRAGLGLAEGMEALMPSVRVAHIGLYRDPATLAAVEYYFKVPAQLDERLVALVDPMLATGNTAVAAADRFKAAGARHLRFVCLLAAPEGIARLHGAHPDIPIYTAAIDSHLNEHGYIVPGLGDAGDRLFGTR
jgi:uracil phosphoribosyltransferase